LLFFWTGESSAETSEPVKDTTVPTLETVKPVPEVVRQFYIRRLIVRLSVSNVPPHTNLTLTDFLRTLYNVV